MTTIFEEKEMELAFENYRQQWEKALLAKLISDQTDLDEQDRRRILKAWMEGLFNGIAASVIDPEEKGDGSMEWQQVDHTLYEFIYTAPYGLKCSLARVYMQPDGSWASLVIAGVKDDNSEAIASAEWAIAKLSTA